MEQGAITQISFVLQFHTIFDKNSSILSRLYYLCMQFHTIFDWHKSLLFATNKDLNLRPKTVLSLHTNQAFCALIISSTYVVNISSIKSCSFHPPMSWIIYQLMSGSLICFWLLGKQIASLFSHSKTKSSRLDHSDGNFLSTMELLLAMYHWTIVFNGS